MKSTVGPIFNIFNAWTVHEQYVNSEPMWGYCSRAGKKKKKKRQNVNAENATLISIQTLTKDGDDPYAEGVYIWL